jgi:hypothetical protein
MVKSKTQSAYQQVVVSLINNARQSGSFIFKVDPNIGAVKSLSNVTSSVPSIPGLYFCFCRETTKVNEHSFDINHQHYTLLYFGKAGHKKNGELTKQKLKERLNNVISDSSRNLKDVKRAIYWEIILNELRENEFLVIWIGSESNCVSDEQTIYSALKSNKHTYPFLNKKLGRRKEKL